MTERTCRNEHGNCSICGAIMYDAPNYCQNCGARVVAMAEYIFKPENDSSTLTSGIEDMCALLPNDWYGTIHEKIVRCRDCANRFQGGNCCFIYEYGYEPNFFCGMGKIEEVNNEQRDFNERGRDFNKQ